MGTVSKNENFNNYGPHILIHKIITSAIISFPSKECPEEVVTFNFRNWLKFLSFKFSLRKVLSQATEEITLVRKSRRVGIDIQGLVFVPK